MKTREKIAWGIVATMILWSLVAVTTVPESEWRGVVEPRPIKFVAGIAFQKVAGTDRWERIE